MAVQQSLAVSAERLKKRDWGGALDALTPHLDDPAVLLPRLHALSELDDTRAMLEVIAEAERRDERGDKVKAWKVVALVREGHIEAAGALAESMDLVGRQERAIVAGIYALVLSGRTLAAASLCADPEFAHRGFKLAVFLPACLAAGEVEVFRRHIPAGYDIVEGAILAMKTLDGLRLSSSDLIARSRDHIWTSMVTLAELSGNPDEAYRMMKLAWQRDRLDVEERLWSAFVTCARRVYPGRLDGLFRADLPEIKLARNFNDRLNVIAAWIGVPVEQRLDWVRQARHHLHLVEQIGYAAECQPTLLKQIASRLPRTDLTGVRADLSCGRPVILALGHFVPTVLVAAHLASLDLPVRVAAGDRRFRYRPDAADMMTRVPAGYTDKQAGQLFVRTAIKQLTSGQVVALPIDTGGPAGRPVPDTAPRLAEKYGAQVYWCQLYWTGEAFATEMVKWDRPTDRSVSLRKVWQSFLEDRFRRIYRRSPATVQRSYPFWVK